MITKLLSIGILLAGPVLTIHGVTIKTTDLLASATSAAGQANISQFRTALDLYFIDHGNYPEVSGGAAMINTLESENYIRENAPLNTNEFNYQAENNGQNYSLELNSGV